MKVCKGICTSIIMDGYQTRKKNKDAYLLGWKRCRICQIYIKGISICVCCKNILASKPRDLKNRNILNKKLGMIRY